MVMPSHVTAGLPFDYGLPSRASSCWAGALPDGARCDGATGLRDKSKINPFAATSLRTLVQMVGSRSWHHLPAPRWP